MIGMIILGVLSVLFALGIGKSAQEDFRVGRVPCALWFVLSIGLNFIPTISINGFSFRVGTALFFLVNTLLFFFYGKLYKGIIAFTASLALGAATYGAIMLARLTENVFFADVNPVYAVVIGIIAVAIFRNGKYAFIVPAEAMLAVNIAIQIPASVNLEYGFDWAVVAAATGFLITALFERLLRGRPTKAAYYFEAGKLGDYSNDKEK